MNAIGTYISSRLATLGKDQAYLVRTSGVSSGSISRIVNGRQQPTAEMLHRLAAPLEVPVSHLLDLAGIPTTQDVAVNDLDLWEIAQEARTDAGKARLLRRLKARWATDPAVIARIEGYLDALDRT